MTAQQDPVLTDGAAARATRPLTGDEYVASLRDDREVYIYGERVKDVTVHPAFRNPVRMTARLYDALHDPGQRGVLTAPTDTGNGGCTHPFFTTPPAVKAYLREASTPPAVKAYLREASTLGSLPRWQLVFDQIERAPRGPLATVLANPLMLWLCRRIYGEDHRDPGELAESPGLGSRQAVEAHLLDAFLPAVYRGSGGRPSPWTAAQARQWLGFLAVFMEANRTLDLAWWRLRTARAMADLRDRARNPDARRFFVGSRGRRAARSCLLNQAGAQRRPDAGDPCGKAPASRRDNRAVPAFYALASGRFVPTRILLARAHRMPLQTLTFLEDAHQRGVLGRTGSTYQFRHLQLQQHLARDHARPPGHSAPGHLEELPQSTAPSTHESWARRFEEQADALADVIGPWQAAGPLYEEPPGVAQQFGTADGRDWVMCAVPGQHPVLMADSIWSPLHHVRAAADDEDAVAALGLPTLPDTTPAGECLIGPDASSLTLACGTLGPAALERTGDNWRWRPNTSIVFREGLASRGKENNGRAQVSIRLPLSSPSARSPVAKPVINSTMAEQLKTLRGSFRLGLTLPQLRAALQAAWQTAADAVPAVILSNPLASITAPPSVSLSLSAPSTPEEILRLDRRKGAREARRARPRTVTRRTVTISGPVIGLSDAEREQYIQDALARLAPGFGYQTG